MTSVDRDVSRWTRTARAVRGQAIGWLVLALNGVSLYLCGAANEEYNSYSVSFDNDCGRLVSTPLRIAVVSWLALALAAVSVPLAVGWSRHRRRARGLTGFPVRGIGLVLTCLALLVTAFCLLSAWGQTTPFHVFCPPSGP